MFCTKKRDYYNSLRGFTLIEALVFLFIFALVSVVFFEVYATGTRMIIESKNRLGATALANQKMEIVRSLTYDALGTKHWNGGAWVYGIPAGDILEDETISVNAAKYEVHTDVQYVDDGYDMTAGTGDSVSTDYKNVKITVSWGEGGPGRSVELSTDIAQNGMEMATGGGTLSINVLDAAGLGVPNAEVRVVNAAENIDFTTQTDASGNIMRPGTPAGTHSYILTLSKAGYYGTTTEMPTALYAPTDPHASVAENELNQKTLVMDLLADIVIRSVDPFGEAIPDIPLRLVGGRVLGTTLDDQGAPVAEVFSYDENLTTDASGVRDIEDESYGGYAISESSARYVFYKLSTEDETIDAFDALPGQTTSVDMVLLDSETGSVMVKLSYGEDRVPIAGATVQLSNGALAYDETETTDQYGLAYFSLPDTGLADGTYVLEVTADGYSSHSSTANVNGSLITKDISLTPL